ncbi:MAG TPA: hypothetical protein VHM19_10185 [Polyangiales bacterium]|jgi:tRNA (pseudouridine54-N1)-methyltransferase|nr:hypothetical protein [Polyangiales bacterium]
MRNFVILGTRARASGDFQLNDIPGTSGRLDVLLRGLRAGLLVSHGIRKDTRVYLVLGGEPENSVVVRVDGAAAKYLRPDDRSLGTLAKKALTSPAAVGCGFQAVKPGVASTRGGLDSVLADVASSVLYVLEQSGQDCREQAFEGDATFFVGDHLGFDPAIRAQLAALGARALSVGPCSLHTEDAVAVLHNELDRRGDQRGT